MDGFGKIRRFLFWTIDSLKSNNVKQHFLEVKLINENINQIECEKKRNSSLAEILEHAKTTTKFYSGNNLNLLSDFPVINKNIIGQNFDQFESISFKDKSKFKVFTSGSTGVPFSTYQNKNKKIRNTADTIYFAEKTGFKLGNELIYIRHWGKQHKKSVITSWVQNIKPYNVVDLTDESISNLLSEIKKSSSNKIIIAYASAYEVICKYLERNNNNNLKNNNIKSLISIAEGLNQYTIDGLNKHFGLSVISRYSNNENGIIAQQESGSTSYHINWASYVVEVLNLENNKPSKLGEQGRIVITDLYNYAVPMIRYDTGDIGVLNLLENETLPVLTKVEGRKMEMLFNTNGKIITSHIVSRVGLYKGVKQYQLIQQSKKNYLFKINITSEFSSEKEIIETYLKYLGSDAIIEFQYVDEIPLLSSGKRKNVINEYYC